MPTSSRQPPTATYATPRDKGGPAPYRTLRERRETVDGSWNSPLCFQSLVSEGCSGYCSYASGLLAGGVGGIGDAKGSSRRSPTVQADFAHREPTSWLGHAGVAINAELAIAQHGETFPLACELGGVDLVWKRRGGGEEGKRNVQLFPDLGAKLDQSQDCVTRRKGDALGVRGSGILHEVRRVDLQECEQRNRQEAAAKRGGGEQGRRGRGRTREEKAVNF